MTDGTGETLDQLCRQVERLVASVPGPLDRVRAQVGEAVLELQWARPGTVAVSATASVVATPVAAVAETADGHLLRAPLVGTFFRAGEPGAKPFIEVGDFVETGQQVGILEAMKLMNPIEADCSGRVLEILPDDGEGVEYDQPLVLIDPIGPE
ncbi:acetyl-CoA carboxylase biotin carboxyl carrier protein [Actinoplanes sp. CA-051413]|jgi:acetyl-CoA carboxylase biotin carboxyl carrier protein|uniref:acetyl-CoA carboxylase biotin carboxyl carrier protein n=1 Tax=Actinoplanes sp. CA-051413 TaxID=3239899 RepID=UPI003D9551C8